MLRGVLIGKVSFSGPKPNRLGPPIGRKGWYFTWALNPVIGTYAPVWKYDEQRANHHHHQFLFYFIFLNTIFVSSHMYPENPEGTRVIVGSMNMGYVSDIARTRTRNLFRPKCAPIPLSHSDGWSSSLLSFNGGIQAEEVSILQRLFPNL